MSKCKDFSRPYLQEHLERLQGIDKYEPRLKLNVLTLKASAGAKGDELYIHLYLDPELRAQAKADLRKQTPEQLSSEQRSFYQQGTL